MDIASKNINSDIYIGGYKLKLITIENENITSNIIKIIVNNIVNKIWTNWKYKYTDNWRKKLFEEIILLTSVLYYY